MERQPCTRVPLAFLPCHHSLIFACGFYNGFQNLKNKCIVMCSLTHSIVRNSSVHFRVFVNFPSFLLLIVYNLMRNAGKNLCDICPFWCIDTSWHSSCWSICLMMKNEFMSTRVFQKGQVSSVGQVAQGYSMVYTFSFFSIQWHSEISNYILLRC